MATRRWSSKAIWMRSGWLRGSIYRVLLFWDRFSVSKPLSQIQRRTLLFLQQASYTPSFGGLGLKGEKCGRRRITPFYPEFPISTGPGAVQWDDCNLLPPLEACQPSPLRSSGAISPLLGLFQDGSSSFRTTVRPGGLCSGRTFPGTPPPPPGRPGRVSGGAGLSRISGSSIGHHVNADFCKRASQKLSGDNPMGV